MKIKKGDQVLIISGKDKGKKGKVTHVLAHENKIVVENVNKVKRHRKPRRSGEKGQIIEIFSPFFASRAMLICPKCNKPTRIGWRILDKGKKQRICKRCQEAV